MQQQPSDNGSNAINLQDITFRQSQIDLIDDLEAQSKQIHIRLIKRGGKKYITTISGLDAPKDTLAMMRKKFSCGGTVSTDDLGETVIQLQGDLRTKVEEYLCGTGIAPNEIFIHGY